MFEKLTGPGEEFTYRSLLVAYPYPSHSLEVTYTAGLAVSLWVRVISGHGKVWGRGSTPELTLEDHPQPERDGNQWETPQLPHPLVAQFWNVLTSLSRGPQQACAPVARSGTRYWLPFPPCPTSLFPPCASWDPLPNKLLAPKSPSRGLFGGEWQFRKTIYYPESTLPSTLEHGWFFSGFVIFPHSLLSFVLLSRVNAGYV